MGAKSQWEGATALKESFKGGYGAGSIFAVKLSIDGPPFFIGTSADDEAHGALFSFMLSLGQGGLGLSLEGDPEMSINYATGNIDLYLVFVANQDWSPKPQPGLSVLPVVPLVLIITAAAATAGVALEPDAFRKVFLAAGVSVAVATGQGDKVPEEVLQSLDEPVQPGLGDEFIQALQQLALVGGLLAVAFIVSKKK